MWQPLRSLQPSPEHINKAPSEIPQHWSNMQLGAQITDHGHHNEAKILFFTHKLLRYSSMVLQGCLDWARASSTLSVHPHCAGLGDTRGRHTWLLPLESTQPAVSVQHKGKFTAWCGTDTMAPCFSLIPSPGPALHSNSLAG